MSKNDNIQTALDKLQVVLARIDLQTSNQSGIPVSDEKPKRTPEEELLFAVFELLLKIPPEMRDAAFILSKKFAKRAERYFKYRGVPDSEAEELVSEAFIKILYCDAKSVQSPQAFFWTVCKNLVLSRARQKNAKKRGDKSKGITEESMDIEDFDIVINDVGESVNSVESIHIKRTFEAFAKSHPVDMQILLLKAEGFADLEIVELVEGLDASTIRSRMYDARKRLKKLYELEPESLNGNAQLKGSNK